MSSEAGAAEAPPPGKPLVGALLLVSVSVLLSGGLAVVLHRGGPWAVLCGAALGSWPLAAGLGRRAFPQRWPLAAGVTAAWALLAQTLGAALIPVGDSTAPAWAEGLSDPWTLAVVSGLALAVSLPVALVQRWPRAGIALGPALVAALVLAGVQVLPSAWLVQVPDGTARPAWALPTGAWLTHSAQGSSTPLMWLLVAWVAGQALITSVTARLAFASERPTWPATEEPAGRSLALCALVLGAVLASGLLLLVVRTPAALAPTLGASLSALPRQGPATSALARLFVRDPSVAPPVLAAVEFEATEEELSVWADLLLTLEQGVVVEGERRLWSLYASRSARGCQRAVSAAWERAPERALLEAGLALAAGPQSGSLDGFLAACEGRGASKADQVAAVAAAHAAVPDLALDHLSPLHRGAAKRAFLAHRLEEVLLELGPERLSANPQAALDVLLAAHASLEPRPGDAAGAERWREAVGAIASQPSGRARLEQALSGPANHLRARATILISCWDAATPEALGLAIQACATSFTGGARPPARLVERLRQAARSEKFPLKLQARAIAHAGPWSGLASMDLRRWLGSTDEARVAALLPALRQLPEGAFAGSPWADHTVRGLALAIERSSRGLEAAEVSVHLFAAAGESESVRQRLIDTIEARAKAADDPARAANLKRIAAALATR